MRRFIFFTIPFVAPLLFSVPDIFAQGLTLEEIVRLGLQVNPKLQSLANLVKAKEGAVQQADVALNPSIGGSLGNRTQLLRIGQELEFPGKRDARKNAALEELGAAKSELQLATLEVEQEIAELFFDILWAQKNLEVLRENALVTDTFLEAARYKLSQGFGGKLDVIKGQVEVARARRLLNSAEQDLFVRENRLRLLLKLEPSQLVSLRGDLSQPNFSPGDHLDSLVALASQLHPSLFIQRHRLKAAEQKGEMARLSSKPNFNLGLSGGIEDVEPAATLSLSIPLAIFDTKKGLREEAQYQMKSAEDNVEQARITVADNVTAAFGAYQTAAGAAKLFEETLLRDAKEAAETARRAFATSGFRFLDLIDAQRTYIDASLEYYNSLRSLRDAEIDLQIAMGKPLLGGQQ